MHDVSSSGIEHVDPVRLPLQIGDDIALFNDGRVFFDGTIRSMTGTALVRIVDGDGTEHELGRHEFERMVDDADEIRLWSEKGEDE